MQPHAVAETGGPCVGARRLSVSAPRALPASSGCAHTCRSPPAWCPDGASAQTPTDRRTSGGSVIGVELARHTRGVDTHGPALSTALHADTTCRDLAVRPTGEPRIPRRTVLRVRRVVAGGRPAHRGHRQHLGPGRLDRDRRRPHAGLVGLDQDRLGHRAIEARDRLGGRAGPVTPPCGPLTVAHRRPPPRSGLRRRRARARPDRSGGGEHEPRSSTIAGRCQPHLPGGHPAVSTGVYDARVRRTDRATKGRTGADTGAGRGFRWARAHRAAVRRAR